MVCPSGIHPSPETRRDTAVDNNCGQKGGLRWWLWCIRKIGGERIWYRDNSSDHWQFKLDANGGGVTTSQAVQNIIIQRIRPQFIYRHCSNGGQSLFHVACTYVHSTLIYLDSPCGVQCSRRPRHHLGDLSERFDSLEVSLWIFLMQPSRLYHCTPRPSDPSLAVAEEKRDTTY